MDDFDREVYCIAGLPFDAINMSQTMSRLRDAKFKKVSCFLTTPNLNFLALSQNDSAFRNSVIHSDIVIADGAPIVWIAKLLGIPILERVAGSSLFEAFGQEQRRKMSVYFFGGPTGVAAEASEHINKKSKGLNCVGYFSPGFGTLDEMSDVSIIDNINMSEADFLVVALGAKKGQAWIVKNLHKIKLPLVSHLGAVINFEAKRLKRAPAIFQKIGLEWAWRIKEEPQLWKRYWGDGKFFLRLLTTKILPYALWLHLNKNHLIQSSQKSSLLLDEDEHADSSKLFFSGTFLDPVSPDIRSLIKQAAMKKKNVFIDLSNTEYLGANIFGLLLMLKKHLDNQGLQLKVIGINPSLKKFFDWNGLTYLIS